MRRPSLPRFRTRYRRRLMLSMAGVLSLVIALVRWWPTPEPSPYEGPYSSRQDERIEVREIQQTTQSRELTPPPPAPLPPVVVPNDRVIEEEIEFGDASIAVEDPGEDERLREGASDEVTTARSPETNPRLFRAVQPEYPSAVRKEGIRARVKVSVFVSETGQVNEAAIVKRWRISPDGSVRQVAQLNQELEKAALIAARRSRFRPATNNGTPVESRTTLTFEFGPEER